MDQRTLLIVIVVAVIAVIAIVLMVLRQRRSERLRSQFGAEYEREVREAKGSTAKAEAELLDREKRIEKLELRPLTAGERDEFSDRWQQVQAGFVDDPQRAIAYADALVAEVMRARGYPVEDFDRRAADISVEHPGLVKNYRSAHEIALRHERGEADTEDARQAFTHYRSLFEDLLRAGETEPARA